MPLFDVLTIISLILVLVSIRVLVTTIRTRKRLFDRDFTLSDRQVLSQVAFFILLPLSVILHELGHAVTILLFGAEITGFGYFFFSGYVAYRGFLTPEEVFWIALSGNLVSVVVGLAAIALPLVRPMRAAVNYLLFAFGAISVLNSLVLYPLVDVVAQMNGDWSQIYSGETPVLSTVTGVVHALILVGAVVAWRSERARRLFAERTGLSSAVVRRVSKTQAANELLGVGERLAESWRHPLRVVADVQDGATGVALHWISGGYGRVVGAYAVVDGWRHIELHGGIQALDGTGERHQQPLGVIEGIPAPEQVAQVLTQALDHVESWHTPAPRRPA